MRIGVPKEIKIHEYRVGLTPLSARELIQHGHEVFVENNAGVGAGFSNADYEQSGAKIIEHPTKIYAEADLIVKVKEPMLTECELLRPGQIIFTFLHLAANLPQVELLLQSGCTAIAYESVIVQELQRVKRPILEPMSQIAGRFAIQAGAWCLEREQGGKGILLGGADGVQPGKVLIFGAGVVGLNAAMAALALGATVTVIDNMEPALIKLSELAQNDRLQCLLAEKVDLPAELTNSDLIIGAVLVGGDRAPKIIKKVNLKDMQAGTVIIDVAIDQGGCCETSRPTTFAQPYFIENEIVHYCVSNMPGAVPRTSTTALNYASLPYILQLADNGLQTAAKNNSSLCYGVNIHQGQMTEPSVAKLAGRQYVPPEVALG